VIFTRLIGDFYTKWLKIWDRGQGDEGTWRHRDGVIKGLGDFKIYFGTF
jgi:hypothetical protein